MSKGWKIAISIISSFLGLIIIFFGVYYLWPWNKDFFDKAKVEFEIPGLDTAFTPQGMTAIDGTDKFIICGYMTDGTASRFYVINDGKVEKYFTLTQAGEDYKGHAGGVTSYGNTLWVAGDKNCYRFSLSDVNTCENGGKVIILDSFQTNNGADFVYNSDGFLWVGEFYKKDKYETDDSHKIKTSSGEINSAIVFGYEIDQSKSYGLVNQAPLPSKALSIRGLCQGIAVTQDGKFVLSTSYSISDSHLYYYENVLSREKDSTISIGIHEVDLWYLDNNSLIKEITIPSMSEEIVIKNNTLYILFESGAKKYKIFNRKQLSNVYSMAVESL